MEQRVSLITLGVADMTLSGAFYTALGWQEAESQDGVVAFDLIGQTLGLYPKEKLWEDIGLPFDESKSSNAFSGITLSYNVREKKDVGDVLDKAEKAGGRILKKASDVFWGGYHGYFADLDGHIWEIAFNPYSPLRDDGSFQWKACSEKDKDTI